MRPFIAADEVIEIKESHRAINESVTGSLRERVAPTVTRGGKYTDEPTTETRFRHSAARSAIPTFSPPNQ